MDIKNSFLNGTLDEEVYMRGLPRFEMHAGSRKVCKLKKSLYGLKQSPREWFIRCSSVMKKLEYKQGQTDHALFVKRSDNGKQAVLIIYVDDMIITSDDTTKDCEFKERTTV